MSTGSASPTTHWLTYYDPDDGEPCGILCSCSIGEDHDEDDYEDED